ncbi:ATP-binding protein [Phenylobacterium sp.]|uniref:ATP-binding protein n=1 Tax=Phenylobacterium sp. TaxID=1871053 RepID=UPI002E34E992|nr:ATP-binding protein [Phenylobacterium sp.]HEX3364989.1 ATP-binding protein [Phenylobacterium sp.]
MGHNSVVKPELNPYSPGAGSRPPELAGRGEILKSCEVALARTARGAAPRGLLLTGLRGVGKTVLLNVIRDEAAAAIFMVDLIEAPEGSPLAPLIIPSLRKTLLRMSVQSTGFWSLPCRCSMSS